MPSTIVPQVKTVRSLIKKLRAVNQSPCQRVHGLPKHSPQKLVAALVKAANELAWDADFQAQLLAKADKRIAHLEKSLGLPSPAECLAQWEAQWEAEEDGRAFLETCAAEHSFRDILA